VLGRIVEDSGKDRDGDGRFDELMVTFEVTSSQAGEFQFGGWLRAGENTFRSAETHVDLTHGRQTIRIAFDGQQIGDNAIDGPYQVEAMWVAPPDQLVQVVDPQKMLDYREYQYFTKTYKANQFEIQAAAIAEGITHQGIDEDGNGLYEMIQVNIPLKVSIQDSYTVEGDLYDGQWNFVAHAKWNGSAAEAPLRFSVSDTLPPYTLAHLNLIQANGPIIDNRFADAYTITDLAGRIDSTGVIFGAISDPKNAPLDVTPGTFTLSPVDTNGNGLYDKLRANVAVSVTDAGTFRAGNYRIEGLLVDEYGTEIAWVVSNPQALVVGANTMTLEFDGKMLYDQLPLAPGAKALKLVAVKIFRNNLSSANLASQVQVAVTSPAYTRSQFESSSPAASLFQDDLENGDGKWTWALPLWSLNNTVWHTWSHAWKASAATTTNGSLSVTSPLDLSNYAGPVLRFNHAYSMASINDKGYLEASTDGTNWTRVATYDGATVHWSVQEVDLSAYGETPGVRLRFNAQAQSGLTWYLDDVFLNAWPAVKSASFTYSPQAIVSGQNVSFTGSYDSIDTTLPITYTWNFNGVLQQTSTPNISYNFPNPGDLNVELTVENPYDSAVTSQIVHVEPNASQFYLTVDISPANGGTVIKEPNFSAYNPGQTVTLTPNPSHGFAFSSWGGACSGSGACVVTMDSDKTVTASFSILTYTLTVNTSGSGIVTRNPDQATYHYGDIVQLTATAQTDWSFTSWSGDLSGYTNPTTVTIDNNKTVNANFGRNCSDPRR